MAGAQTALQYLRGQMEHLPGGPAGFLREYKELSDKDKTELKDYASKEMAVLGIPEEPAKTN